MLRTRIITAAVLVPPIVAGILWLPTVAVAVLFALLMIVGAREWAHLARLQQARECGAYVALYCVLAALLLLAGHLALAWPARMLVCAACLWWLVALYWLWRYPRGWAAGPGRPLIGSAIGLLALCAAVAAIQAIHGREQGAGLLLLFFVLVWGADTGAYFVGRSLGRHKLAVAISPGKTREGAAGGIAVAILLAAVGASVLQYNGLRWLGLVVLGGWVAGVSIVGDLTLSMFKRHAEIKDSGNFFPGHGGVLDRLDSALAAAPWFAVGLLLAGIET